MQVTSKINYDIRDMHDGYIHVSIELFVVSQIAVHLCMYHTYIHTYITCISLHEKHKYSAHTHQNTSTDLSNTYSCLYIWIHVSCFHDSTFTCKDYTSMHACTPTYLGEACSSIYVCVCMCVYVCVVAEQDAINASEMIKRRGRLPFKRRGRLPFKRRGRLP